MIQVIHQPGKYVFVGNPIIFEFKSETADPLNIAVAVAGESYEFTRYPFGSGAPYITSINIASLLSPFMQEYKIEDGYAMVSQVSDLLLPYSLKVNDVAVRSGLALRGGVSRANYKYLRENEEDIFSFKILNPLNQFIFTSRTFDKTISIRESELSSFVFLHPGTVLTFRSDSGEKLTMPALARETPAAMNVQAICKSFASIPHVLDVYAGGAKSFSFRIMPAAISEERYLLTFRNSFGVFEVLEVVGVAYNKPIFSEENKYKVFTDGIFEGRRARVDHVDSMEVESGYKMRSEHNFILDLAKSEDIYITVNGIKSRCLVTAPDMKYRELIIAPSSVNLVVTLVDDESYVDSDLVIKKNRRVLGTESLFAITTHDGKLLLI